MYIFKNALRSISRAKARNILIGIIALVIAVSACVALSIKESAAKARESALESLQITAQISVDRQSIMSKAKSSGSFDKNAMAATFQSSNSPSLDELQTYSTADSVKNFYYTLSTSLNANDDITPIDTQGSFSRDTTSSSSSTSSSANSNKAMQAPGNEFPGNGIKNGMMGKQGDFTVVGYSSDEAMTDFISGVCTITSGTMFTEGTSDLNCIISDELATANDIAVGSTITLLNPNNESETVTFTVVGIYNNSQSSVSSTGSMGFSTSTDSANRILTSYTAIKSVLDTSTANATTTTNSTTGLTTSNAMSSQLSGTYVFADLDAYNAFEPEVRALGLSDTYTVSSSDLTSFNQSMQPLDNLSKIATYFLIVVFAIGAIILIVLNIFNIRERKYEIGVLTAIGMKKPKVAFQFVVELFAVTFIAIMLGAGIGAATSVPVTNALLASQIQTTTANAAKVQSNFGRPGDSAGNAGGTTGTTSGSSKASTQTAAPSGNGFMGSMFTSATNYVSQVSYSTDINVILELIGMGILLTLVSSLSAVTFIMRYEPLKILTSRN